MQKDNIEDLCSMTVKKMHKYIAETRNYIYPLADFAKQNYPETSDRITALKSKIVSLTELTENLVAMHEEKHLGNMQMEN